VQRTGRQGIPQIDAEIAETGDPPEGWGVQAKRGQKGHLWMETKEREKEKGGEGES